MRKLRLGASLVMGLAGAWMGSGMLAPESASATETRVVIVGPGLQIRVGDGRTFQSRFDRKLDRRDRRFYRSDRRFDRRFDRRDRRFDRRFDRKDRRFDRKDRRFRGFDRRFDRSKRFRNGYRIRGDRPGFRTYRYKQYRFRSGR